MPEVKGRIPMDFELNSERPILVPHFPHKFYLLIHFTIKNCGTAEEMHSKLYLQRPAANF